MESEKIGTHVQVHMHMWLCHCVILRGSQHFHGAVSGAMHGLLTEHMHIEKM